MSPYTDGRPDPTIPELLFPAETGSRGPEALREDLRRARGEAEREAKRWAGLAGAAYRTSAYLSKSMSNPKALEDLARDMPSGPHARLLQLALLNSADPVATAEGVGQAAEAISDALQMITPVVWDE